MTFNLRSPALFLCGFVLFLAQSACDPRELKVACRDHNDCTEGRVCASIAGAAPTCTSPPPPDASVDTGVDLLPPVQCGDVWNPVTLSASTEIPALLVGKWRRCGGGEPASMPSPFEFADDGKWYQLQAQSDGSTVRLTGWGQMGTWEIDSASQVGTTGRIFVYWNNAPGSSLWATVSFTLDPRVMQLDPALYTPLP